MGTLPLELLHFIAETDELTYRGISAVPFFARSITMGKILDYMVLFQHDVKIEDQKIIWYRNGQIHRKSGPALGYSDGDKCWYRNGQKHRNDGPAFEFIDGTKHWYRNGQIHRNDGPAFEYADGGKVWVLNDKIHKEDGPAIEYANGDKCWYRDGIEYFPR